MPPIQKNIMKDNLHPNNLHNRHYDFVKLTKSLPELEQYLIQIHHQQTIDFANPSAVLALNKALLKAYYRIDYWNLPSGYLCPPIPGRADYIHYLADLLKIANNNQPVSGSKVTALDIGTGASCIYPILGQRCYQWRFLASDIDPVSVATAQQILKSNKGLVNKIAVFLQPNANAFFSGILDQHKVDITLCNPPFHASLKQAGEANLRKNINLNKNKKSPINKQLPSKLNFGGQKAELFCQGGEINFIQSMILESKNFAEQVLYFTCLVSKKKNLPNIIQCLNKVKAEDIKVFEMAQGQKISRFIAWSFKNERHRRQWCQQRLNNQQDDA